MRKTVSLSVTWEKAIWSIDHLMAAGEPNEHQFSVHSTNIHISWSLCRRLLKKTDQIYLTLFLFLLMDTFVQVSLHNKRRIKWVCSISSVGCDFSAATFYFVIQTFWDFCVDILQKTQLQPCLLQSCSFSWHQNSAGGVFFKVLVSHETRSTMSCSSKNLMHFEAYRPNSVQLYTHRQTI